MVCWVVVETLDVSSLTSFSEQSPVKRGSVILKFSFQKWKVLGKRSEFRFEVFHDESIMK